MKAIKTTFYKRRRKNKRLLIAILLVLPFQLVDAQNKVVVIPLLGDDAPAREPTAPLAKDSPNLNDYEIVDDFTVIDNVTGLEWQREDDNDLRNWNDSLDYCSELTLGGKADWHLPDILELKSILDYGRSAAPLIIDSLFPGTESENYWSASIGSSESRFAWGASFNIGFVGERDKSRDFYVRCVR